MDVWKELKGLTANAPVWVGLFHSGEDRVYVARVVDVVLPTDGTDEAPPLPAGGKDLVPLYYRESPFSRAWMKIDSIKECDNFFSRFSFAERPRIHNYSDDVLKQFDHKAIVSAAELRGMDTTIWRVRNRNANDNTQTIILSTPSLQAAISSEPVACKANSILHLTDIHFGTGSNRQQHVWKLEEEEDDQGGWTLSDAISNCLRGKHQVGAVIVTGDLTFTGAEEEFNQALKFFRRLQGQLDIPIDNFVIIPGNHDIRWSVDDAYEDGAEVTRAPREAQENYRNFHRKLFGYDADPYLAMGRKFALPSGIMIEVAGLNSSSLAQGKNFLAGMGRIEEASLEEAANKLGWHDDMGTLALRILAVHHHLALTEDLEPADKFAHGFGIAIDSVRIQRAAARKSVKLALHGHKHRPFIWRSSVYELPDGPQNKYERGDLSLIGGGSAGSSDADANFFNFIEIPGPSLKTTLFSARKGQKFSSISTWHAPIEINSAKGGLELRDWVKAN